MTGKYAVERLPGGELVLASGADRYKVRKRAKVSPDKPRWFLIRFKPYYRYISSLFETEQPGLYTFDCDCVQYCLWVDGEQAEIKVALPVSAVK